LRKVMRIYRLYIIALNKKKSKLTVDTWFRMWYQFDAVFGKPSFEQKMPWPVFKSKAESKMAQIC
jgi:hypothetical protein